MVSVHFYVWMEVDRAILTLAILIGLIHCESIITPPEDVSEMVGSMAMFQCDIEFDRNPVMVWEHNDKVIYSYYDGAESYKINHGKYSVEQDGRRFTLTVNRLEYKDGGTYTCRAIKSRAAANLIVLDIPVLITHAPSYHTGMQVFCSCVAYFGGPPKEKISHDHFPKLQMRLGETHLEGTVEEVDDENDEEYYILRQNYYMILEPRMDGKTITCEITTSNPEGSATASNTINVLLPDPASPPPGNDKGEENDDRNYAVPDKEQKEGNATPTGTYVLMGVILVFLCILSVLAAVAFGSYKTQKKKKKKISPRQTIALTNVLERHCQVKG